MGLHGVTSGYKRLAGVLRDYKGLPRSHGATKS